MNKNAKDYHVNGNMPGDLSLQPGLELFNWTEVYNSAFK